MVCMVTGRGLVVGQHEEEATEVKQSLNLSLFTLGIFFIK